jgi:hypothetical protein
MDPKIKRRVVFQEKARYPTLGQNRELHQGHCTMSWNRICKVVQMLQQIAKTYYKKRYPLSPSDCYSSQGTRRECTAETTMEPKQRKI